MLQPHEILAHMPTTLATQLLDFLIEKEKPLFKATLDSLANQRKLRPVFVERKPRAERFQWMHDQLGRKQSNAVAAHLLQVWLMGAHHTLLCEFLDGFGITHDEHGMVENLPPSPSKADLQRVIDGLLTRYEAPLLAVYLHTFQALDEQGWEHLGALLQEDSRLTLVPAGAPVSA